MRGSLKGIRPHLCIRDADPNHISTPAQDYCEERIASAAKRTRTKGELDQLHNLAKPQTRRWRLLIPHTIFK